MGITPSTAAEPERDRRRLALRVDDPHLARLDLPDQVGGVAQLEDVARHALDREVFVERADEGVRRLEQDAVVTDVGDRAPRRDGGEPRAAAPAQAVVDAVVVHVRGAPAAAGREALREHLDDVVEVPALEIAVGVGAAHQLVQRAVVPLFARDCRYDLLRQDVERMPGDDQPVQLALPRGPQQRRALDQLVARQREQPPLRHGGEMVARAPHPLQQRRDRAGRADLAHQVHRPDVDPELERRRGDERPELPLLEARLGIEPLLLREAAMMRRHVLRAHPLRQMHGHPLGEPPRVHEHERGAVLGDELRHAIVQLVPHLGRHHGLERRRGDLDREIQLARVTGIDDAGASG